MWFFAHVGLTVGLAAVVDVVARRASPSAALDSTPGLAAAGARSNLANPAPSWRAEPVERARSWLALTRKIDYRLVAVGSVLPDFDKPLSLLMYGRFDRGVFHTLLFTFLVAGVGIYLFRRSGNISGLLLGYCWVMHLILDEMWDRPRLLLWPLRGWNPGGGRLTLQQFSSYMDRSLTGDPSQYLPELAGLALFGALVWYLASRGELVSFLKTGRIGSPRP